MKIHILLTIILAAPTTIFADPADDVRCREIGFSKSIESRDLAKFRSFVDEDARFVGNSVTRGATAVAEAWSIFIADDGPRIKWRPQFVEVLQDGTLALTRGPFRMTVKDPEGNETEQWGTFNSVWRLKADGEWRVVFDAGSAAAQPPPDEVKALLDQKDDCKE